MVLVVALVSIATAANPENRVLGLVSYAWAGFGAAFGPVVLFSVMWSRMTRNGALAGMIIGAVTVIVWKQFGWLGLYEIIPCFIFGSPGLWSSACWVKRLPPRCSDASPKQTPIITRAAGTRDRRVSLCSLIKPALCGLCYYASC